MLAAGLVVSSSNPKAPAPPRVGVPSGCRGLPNGKEPVSEAPLELPRSSRPAREGLLLNPGVSKRPDEDVGRRRVADVEGGHGDC